MKREEQLSRLRTEEKWDIIVIGGGATGLGCAVDAATRGLKTLLLEKNDFSSGTSSRSTKLVHGGVRYLAQGNVRLVRDALIERGFMLKNAPHVCHSLSFIVPSIKWWHKWFYGVGLFLYDLLSGSLSLGSTRVFSLEKTIEALPQLDREHINGGVRYYDGQFDDSRLAVNLAQTAAENGAAVINYCGVTGFIKREGTITGVMATDELSGEHYTLLSSAVINATGVFADEILQKAENSSEVTITPSQGIHLTIDRKFFGGSAAMMIPKTDDGRVLFAIPWHDTMLLGTTDTPVDEITLEPRPLREEIDFIITHFNRYSSSAITENDVKSVFAGLRPLARTSGSMATSVMPRDHKVTVLKSGLIHVTGGKWTAYRRMAEDAVNKAVVNAELKAGSCITKTLRIHGCTDNPRTDHLSVYGSDAEKICEMMKGDPYGDKLIHQAFQYTRAEIRWILENEMAVTLEDVLARRTRMLFLDAGAAAEAAQSVAAIFASCRNIPVESLQNQVDAFIKKSKDYTLKS